MAGGGGGAKMACDAVGCFERRTLVGFRLSEGPGVRNQRWPS